MATREESGPSRRDDPWEQCDATSDIREDGRPVGILQDFYIPALSPSTHYDRVAGSPTPPRAGMVRKAGDWAWRSDRAMVGQASAPAWLESDWLLGQVGEDRVGAPAGDANFVHQGVGGASLCLRCAFIRRWRGVRRDALRFPALRDVLVLLF